MEIIKFQNIWKNIKLQRYKYQIFENISKLLHISIKFFEEIKIVLQEIFKNHLK